MSAHNTDPEIDNWANRGLCAQIGNDDIWFPERGATAKPARAICAQCPVRNQCLQDALQNDDSWGIRAGLTPLERRKLRHQLGVGQPSGRVGRPRKETAA